MVGRRGRWLDRLAPVGEAGLELLRAEYGVVSSEIKVSARVLVKSLLLLLVGLFALFWAIGALALVLLEVGALWLPRWAAAGSVLVLFVAAGLIFATVARNRLKSVEPPTRTVRKRLDEHRDWWEDRVARFTPPSRARRRAPGADASTSEPEAEA